MKQAPGRLGGWRWAVLVTGLTSLLMVALPAEAGLGDLVDDVLGPVGDAPVVGEVVAPIVEDVVDPLVEDIVKPVAGELVDPIVDKALTPIVTTAVPPVVDDTATPVPDIELAPVAETIPPVGTTTTIGFIESDQADADGESKVDPASSGYPKGVLVADTLANSSGGVPVRSTTPLTSLETALALQTTLVDSATLYQDVDPAPAYSAQSNWLNGLTNWLRSNTDGFVNILALPIQLIELLTRALLTAGSGLIAPLSMLLALTAFVIKDQRWLGASAIDHFPGRSA